MAQAMLTNRTTYDLVWIQARLESLENKPIMQFLVSELKDPTFDSLNRKLVALQFDYEDDQQVFIDLNQYDVKIQYQFRPGWLVDIPSTAALMVALEEKSSEGVVMMHATIVEKNTCAAVKQEIVPAAAAAAPAVKPTKGASTKRARAPASTKTSAATKKAKTTKITGSPVDRILGGMVQLRACGIHDPPRDQVQVVSGYGGRKPGFDKQLSTMKKDGLIGYGENKTLHLCEAGLAIAPNDIPAANSAELHDRIKEVLQGGPAKKIFDFLSDGQERLRSDIAAACGYDNAKTPGFLKALGYVKTPGFLEYPSKESARLTDLAFPLGRPVVSDMSDESSEV